MDPTGDAYAARLGQPFEPGCYIDPVAEDISVLHHDVADVHSDAKLHPAIRFEGAVRRRKLVLDVDCALNRGQGAAEGGENAVAGGAANSSAMLGDETVSDQAKSRQGRQRSLFVHSHQTAIARDIRGKNGDEPSLEGRRFHVLSLISPGVSAPKAP